MCIQQFWTNSFITAVSMMLSWRWCNVCCYFSRNT